MLRHGEFGCALGQAGEAIGDYRSDQRFLGREVPVDGSGTDASALRDHIERHVGTFLRERRPGGGQHPLAVAAGIGSEGSRAADQWAPRLLSGAYAPYIYRGE